MNYETEHLHSASEAPESHPCQGKSTPSSTRPLTEKKPVSSAELVQEPGKRCENGSNRFNSGGDNLAAYRALIKAKTQLTLTTGFEVSLDEIHPFLKSHQGAGVQWAVRGGRRALFESFGLGKTVQQLEIIRLILSRAGGRGLIVAPLGVRQEFRRDGEKLGIEVRFIRSIDDCNQADLFPAGDPVIYLTNYETVRDGKLDPRQFTAASLDEAAALRGLGGTKTFREFMKLFDGLKYKFVATATPDPNEYIELLAYAAFLEIMDVGQAKTRFFKRDSTKADRLTIHPHKEKEFWLWVASWALFLQKPSDLGFSDEGYDLPQMEVVYHEVAVDHSTAEPDKRGQGQMFRDATRGVVDAAREKRNTIDQRISEMCGIIDAEPEEHFLLWHDLEAEREEITEAVPGSVAIYGSQDLDEREHAIIDFSDGKIQYLAAKPVIAGSGCNFQRHCARMIFCGIGFKFNDFIQAIHRCYRFLQTRKVIVHLIYAESEKRILENLLAKWNRYAERAAHMADLIQEYGLSEASLSSALARSIGVERVEVSGENYRLVNNDCVEETSRMPESSVDLILTSIPFSTQYEYTPSYNDFGHTESNSHFWRQMGYLMPELLRILKPGRIAAIHVKDRIVPGGINKLGFQTVYPFHVDAISHFVANGFAYMGMKTIVTDVVRENNQTYRLGWTEQCKDGTKMGVGMPEYLLLFRKPPSDSTNSYADEPVTKTKPDSVNQAGDVVPFDRNLPIQPGTGYSRSRWQIDAHGFTRSSGNRLLTPEEFRDLPHHAIFKLFRRFSIESVYDFEHHVKLGESLEARGILPVTFMLLQPQSWASDVWTDITRMLTLNGAQSAKGKEMHLCPMQFDLADRAIRQYTMEGETVFDPFGGLMTVPFRAVRLKRKAIGVELNPAYFLDGSKYVEAAARELNMPTLFDLEEETDSDGRSGQPPVATDEGVAC